MSDDEATPSAPAATNDDDDVKRRYKEALDRKNSGRAAGEAHTDNDGGAKAHDAHGPAKAQRTFRRKSG